MFQTLSKGDQREQGEDEVTQDAIVRQYRQGKGKGKGKGKKGARWNCDESDHYSRVCPDDKQDNISGQVGAWEIQKGSKAGKDASK